MARRGRKRGDKTKTEPSEQAKKEAELRMKQSELMKEYGPILAHKRFDNRTPEQKLAHSQYMSKIRKEAWARYTKEELSAEMRRRAQVRAENKRKKPT